MLIPRARPLVVSVPRESNFRIPEGKYRAQITSVKKVPVQKLNSVGELVKLLLAVQVPSLPNYVNLARAEFKFDMHSGSELRNILTRLFGKEALVQAAGKSFDLGQLSDLAVEIEIEHVTTSRRDEYAYPLVKVRDLQKPGTMCLTEYAEATQ